MTESCAIVFQTEKVLALEYKKKTESELEISDFLFLKVIFGLKVNPSDLSNTVG